MLFAGVAGHAADDYRVDQEHWYGPKRRDVEPFHRDRTTQLRRIKPEHSAGLRAMVEKRSFLKLMSTTEDTGLATFPHPVLDHRGTGFLFLQLIGAYRAVLSLQGQGSDGYLVRLGDVARVEKGANENRTFFRGNGVPMVGIGIIKQSTANTIAVADAAKAEMARINPTLPDGMSIRQSYDTSVFVKGAIAEVYKTLSIAIALVVTVIFVFLGSVRAMLVPAVTVPISLIATSLVLLALDYSVNMLTLLALVLAIGLVVDDAIVVLENIYRQWESGATDPVEAAVRGSRQVVFAVLASCLPRSAARSTRPSVI